LENILLKSINPATGEVIGQVECCSETEYEHLVQSAQTAFETWRTVPAPKRGELIRQLGDKLRAHKTALGRLVTQESGKSLQEGSGEIQEMIDMADMAVGQARMLYGNTMHSERPEHRMYEQWHPLGIVGVITAFNFPVAVWAWNAFIAAVCGNVVIWKPSSQVPLCAVAVQKLCNEVMTENGYAHIFSLFIPKDHPTAEKLLTDSRIGLVSFTGSTPVGRHVSEIISTRLGRTLLELGGNNAMIVDETASLDLAVPAIVFGAVGTAGQRCTTLRRLIVHESRYDDLLQRLRHAYQQIRIGDPLDENVLMGPLINTQAVQAYEAAIQAAQKLGGEIVYGGHVLKGNFVEPTIMRAENHWDVVQRETFAPILWIMPYQVFEDAVKLQNHAPQGLSSALFTNHLQHAEYFLSAWGSDCGIANINMGTSGAEIGGAFGGEKMTGGGREAGSDAWKAYMRRQTNTINWGSSLPLAQGIKFELG
jgi:aldehyde dehydrogenase (NAD+)